MNEVIIMEVTAKEAQMIMQERKKAGRQAKREAYIAELNNLIQRIKADGFTVAANRPFRSCESITFAIDWQDKAGNYIGLC